ncbi:hypothetical protein GLYMA_12G152351v4 [Glycine max]|nr:hypothetical protein GLYMA_12G152351v4 [Glycine max]KAH1143307.1 hypothetical protein GYH30_033832 [Glycine max]
MILDNLPLVVPLRRPDHEYSLVYLHGFLVGLQGQFAGNKDEKHFIHNLLTFIVKYHRDPVTEMSRIVRFEVKPFSVKHEYDGEWDNTRCLTTCDPHAKKLVSGSEPPQEVEDKEGDYFYL